MKMLLALLALALGAFALLVPMKAPKADSGFSVYMYRVNCNPDRDFVELTQFDADYDRVDVDESIDPYRFGKDQPIYLPEKFFNLDATRRVWEGKLVNEDYGVQWASIECPLNRGIVKLELLPEIITQPPDRVDDTSFSIWLRVAGRWILDDVPIRRCEDETIVHRLRYDAARSELLVESYIANPEAKAQSTYPNKPLEILAQRFAIESSSIRPIGPSSQTGLDWRETTGPLRAEHVYRRWAPPPADEPELLRCDYSRPGGPRPRRW